MGWWNPCYTLERPFTLYEWTLASSRSLGISLYFQPRLGRAVGAGTSPGTRGPAHLGSLYRYQLALSDRGFPWVPGLSQLRTSGDKELHKVRDVHLLVLQVDYPLRKMLGSKVSDWICFTPLPPSWNICTYMRFSWVEERNLNKKFTCFIHT